MQESFPELNVFARVAHYLNLAQRKLITNAFNFSQFGYYPLVWTFHIRELNNRINKIYELTLGIVFRDYESTFQQLLKKKSLNLHIEQT